MEASEPQQVFVRNDKGRLWGPITPQTLELLLDNGLVEGRIQLSTDGVNFAFPGRFEDLREFVPPNLWGDGFAKEAAAFAARLQSAAQEPAQPSAAPSAPMAGPGALNAAAPLAGPGARAATAAPMAGPGARAAATAPRSGPGASHTPQAHRGEVHGPPPVVPGRPPAAGPVSPPVSAPRAPQPAPTPAAPVAPPAPRPAPSATTPAELGVSEMPSEGDLARISAIRLYYLAAAHGLTGRLALDIGDRLVELHFKKGSPQHVASSHTEDAVGVFLLRENLATPEQVTQAELAQERFGGDLLAALFGTGALNPANVFPRLVQRAHGILLKAFIAWSGSFRWTEEELPPQKAMPLGNRWGVLMELARKVPPKLIRHRMEPAVDLPVMKSGGLIAVNDLRLTPQEMRAIGFIDGVRSLNLLARDLPQDAEAFFRLSWVLRELDIVSFAATPLKAPPPPAEPRAAAPEPKPAPAAAPVAPPPSIAAAAVTPAAPRPTAPAASAPPAAPAAAPARPAPPVMTPKISAPRPSPPEPGPAAPVDFVKELAELRGVYEKQKDQNYFEVLGVRDNADSGAVKRAYFKLARVYHPDTVPPGAPADLGKLKADVFAKIGEAYRTLGDDGSRAEYIEDLKAGGGGDVDVAAILHAEELFQKGCILVKAKKFPEAVEMLSDAIATNGDEGEFYAWRAAARFFASKDRQVGQAEAARDLEQALKKNPRCAQAYFFEGQIAKLLGDQKKALASLKKTLDLQPDHLDAQREIRYLTKK